MGRTRRQSQGNFFEYPTRTHPPGNAITFQVALQWKIPIHFPARCDQRSSSRFHRESRAPSRRTTWCPHSRFGGRYADLPGLRVFASASSSGQLDGRSICGVSLGLQHQQLPPHTAVKLQNWCTPFFRASVDEELEPLSISIMKEQNWYVLLLWLCRMSDI